MERTTRNALAALGIGALVVAACNTADKVEPTMAADIIDAAEPPPVCDGGCAVECRLPPCPCDTGICDDCVPCPAGCLGVDYTGPLGAFTFCAVDDVGEDASDE